MRVVPCVMILAVCLELTGCNLFQKKNSSAPPSGPDPLLPRADRSGADSSSDVRPASASEPNNPVQRTSSSGILAGRVIDSWSRPVAEAYVLVSLPKQKGEPEKKPIDVAVNDQGYFMISGLKPGRYYQLTARGRDGRHLMAGTTWATPPQVRLVIGISERFVTKSTPPLPPPPAWGSQEEKTSPANAAEQKQKTTAAEQKWGPRGTQPETSTAPRLGNNIEVTPEVTTPPAPSLERVAEGEKNPGPGTPLSIPGGQPRASATGEPAWSPSLAASRVPSCVLVGKQLLNFALNDLDGKVFEFRKRTGKVVLLDFWGSQCPPCLATIPHLKSLQEKYRTAGLQVIGIAYENDGSPEQQRRRVDAVCQRLKVNYKVLLGSADCPVKQQLRIRSLPTLILVDENGWLIDEHIGRPSASTLEELDQKIQRWLGISRTGR